MIELTMPRELVVFFVMVCCGAAVAVFFDFLRAVRIFFKPNAIVVGITDTVFWVLSAFAAAACVWNFYDGKLRFFEPVGLGLGVVLYFSLLSKWILRFFLFLIENIFKIVRVIFKILLTPALFLYKILVVPIKGITVSVYRKTASKVSLKDMVSKLRIKRQKKPKKKKTTKRRTSEHERVQGKNHWICKKSQKGN